MCIMEVNKDKENKKNNKIFLIWVFLILIPLIFSISIIISEPGAINEIGNFIQGGEGSSLSIIEKIANDTGLRPNRNLVDYEYNSQDRDYQEITELSLRSRRDNPEFFLDEKAPYGYRLIYGAFDFDDKLHGAILLDPDGKVVHKWKISQEGTDYTYVNDENCFPHGLEVFSDGSIITAFDGSISTLTKYDYCGNIIWRLNGIFHHSIVRDNHNGIWVWGGYDGGSFHDQAYADLLNINYDTGELIRSIDLRDVMAANPDIDILGVIQKTFDQKSYFVGHPEDYWHPNDIEPLPDNLADKYELFSADDLLISLRNLNLIFVIDPDSLEIKWWRQGVVRKQHDPDWNDRGTITMFNNNINRVFSNIVEINPLTYEYWRPVEGEAYNFYSWHRGNKEETPSGGYLITSTDQGRVFEIDKDGNLVFEYLNIYDKDKGVNLAVSEARFFPVDYFENLTTCQ